MITARSICVRGVVQGVGFRPFVFRLARLNNLAGWVLNAEQGVEIFLEGADSDLQRFLRDFKANSPSAACISEIEVVTAVPKGLRNFAIRESERRENPTVRISPDLPVCDACIRELFGAQDRRYLYPYINCTECGPRYSVIERLPYDRPNTTMKAWPLGAYCNAEYHDPANRRFHAQPVACPECGPHFSLRIGNQIISGSDASIRRAAELLRSGSIIAIKGIGGYHLACDAQNSAVVTTLRERKFRKEKPFALMVRNIESARKIVELSAESEALLCSAARPIVLAKAKVELAEVAPDSDELGVMLPYAPLHFMLFAAGAPEILVMTSANRSSEPVSYKDDDAVARLSEIADAFLIGERPIARRVDDSIARVGTFGPVVLRRARGYAPGAVTVLPSQRPILAVGADLKNSITLVVAGQAFVSQHIGDLSHYESLLAFQETVFDLVTMYGVRWSDLLVVHDAHPEYVSTVQALGFDAGETHSVQHHRAHIASVIAERQAWDKQVIGVSFDGTGYGDDGTIWGGEIFCGSIASGFERVSHLRPAILAGGDAAAEYPVQAAAGFLAQLDGVIESNEQMFARPFYFPERYRHASELIRKQVRTFTTTSVGRLFDTVAALLGFTRGTTYEGQAAIWLEHIAHRANSSKAYPFPFDGNELDFRPLLECVVRDRAKGCDIAEISRAFHVGVAAGLSNAVKILCEARDVDTLVLSGGVFQNELLLREIHSLLRGSPLQIWTNHAVPPNDGGISFGQAALAAFRQFNSVGIQRSHSDLKPHEKVTVFEQEISSIRR